MSDDNTKRGVGDNNDITKGDAVVVYPDVPPPPPNEDDSKEDSDD